MGIQVHRGSEKEEHMQRPRGRMIHGLLEERQGSHLSRRGVSQEESGGDKVIKEG